MVALLFFVDSSADAEICYEKAAGGKRKESLGTTSGRGSQEFKNG